MAIHFFSDVSCLFEVIVDIRRRQKLLLVNDQSAREHGCGNGIRVIVWDNEAPFAEEVCHTLRRKAYELLLERKQWQLFTDVSQVASLRAPVVIKNTSVLQWNALKRWSLEYLESRVQHLDNVKHGNRSCFVAVNEKFNQLDPEVEIERHDHFRTENMTMQEFAQFVRNGSLQQSYVYYSGEMKIMQKIVMKLVFWHKTALYLGIFRKTIFQKI